MRIRHYADWMHKYGINVCLKRSMLKRGVVCTLEIYTNACVQESKRRRKDKIHRASVRAGMSNLSSPETSFDIFYSRVSTRLNCKMHVLEP